MRVFPGDKVGNVEEYMAGEGVYEESSELFASVAGLLRKRDKIVSVESFKKIPELKKGDIVVGRVVDVRNSFAMIEIARKKGEDRDLAYTGLGMLHISNVGEKIDNISNAICYFDIVKARVIDTSPRLSIQEKEMGVLKAYCTQCKSELKFENRKLKCPNCGREERRKISESYGKGEW